MIAKYKNNEVHAKCVEYLNKNIDYDNSPKGLSLVQGTGRWDYKLSDGSAGFLGGISGPLIRMDKWYRGKDNQYTCVEIFIPDFDVDLDRKDKTKERIISASDVYVRCRTFTDSSTVSETVWTDWRRLAFADEIPKATCPFPIGFSFMLTTAYTDGTISDLKTAYPGTDWGYAQVAGLYNTNVIRRIK